jgi:hypothetical protein
MEGAKGRHVEAPPVPSQPSPELGMEGPLLPKGLLHWPISQETYPPVSSPGSGKRIGGEGGGGSHGRCSNGGKGRPPMST